MDGEQEVQSTPSATPEAVVSQPVNESTTETQNEPIQETTSTETVPAATNGYEGNNFVEFTPEQQKRINTLTKKMGNYERESNEWKTVAKQQYDLINELRNGQQQIVNHLQTTNFADVEYQLKTQRKEAFARGDMDAVDEVNDKLTEIKLTKKTAELQAKLQPARPIVQPNFTSDPVEQAVQQGTLSRNDAEVYQAWVNETDQYGNLVRPWTGERDSRNSSAAAEGKAVFSNPVYQNKPFAERLKEIDRRMGMTNQQMQQGVLPAGNLTRGGKNSNVKLSSYAENLAIKTKFAGPGKSNSDHIEAYRKQMAEVRGAKR